MAESNSTAVPIGPTNFASRERLWDAQSESFQGPAGDLVVAGVAPSLDVFPGRPGRPKTVCHYDMAWQPRTSRSFSREGTAGFSIYKIAAGQFSVCRRYSEDEESVRDAHAKASQAADSFNLANHDDSESTRKELEREILNAMFVIARATTHWEASMAKAGAKSPGTSACAPYWRIGGEDGDQLFDLSNGALRAALYLVRDVKFVPGPLCRKATEPARVIGGDPDFQRFLQRTFQG